MCLLDINNQREPVPPPTSVQVPLLSQPGFAVEPFSTKRTPNITASWTVLLGVGMHVGWLGQPLSTELLELSTSGSSPSTSQCHGPCCWEWACTWGGWDSHCPLSCWSCLLVAAAPRHHNVMDRAAGSGCARGVAGTATVH